MVRAKRTRITQLEQARHLCVVAYLPVGIKGQVNRVETTSALNERFHPLKVRPDQPLWLAPEEPVMDNEKLSPFRHRLFKRSQTGVYSESHSLDLIRALNLQTILGLVLDLPDPEIVVQVVNQFVTSHSTILLYDIKASEFHLGLLRQALNDQQDEPQ
jgi:hypothetical protein